MEPYLKREWEQEQAQTTLQIARQWFNAALAARKAGDIATAEHYAVGVLTTGKSTYLYEEALLLHAQCAENRDSPQTVSRYVRLVNERPQSVYAPVALSKAAAAAEKQGKRSEAESYRRRLREAYPRSPEAVRTTR